MKLAKLVGLCGLVAGAALVGCGDDDGPGMPDAAGDTGRPDSSGDSGPGNPDARPDGAGDTSVPDTGMPDGGDGGMDARMDGMGDAMPSCTDDMFEDNDDGASAAMFPAAGTLNAQICADDVDYYAVAVTGRCNVHVELMHDASAGDLELYLLDADEGTVDSSTSTGDLEEINARVDTAGTYYVYVEGYDGGENDYQLAVDVICTPPCPDDDAFEPNDTTAMPRTLTTEAPISAVLCGTDDDVYAIEVGAGCAVGATIDLSSATADTALTVIESGGAVVATGTIVDGDGRVHAVPGSAGTYYVRVAGTTPEVYYDLVVDVSCPGMLSCPGDDLREDDDTRDTAPVLNDGATLSGIYCYGDDDLARIEVQRGCDVTTTLVYVPAMGELEVDLLDASGEVVESGFNDDRDDAETLTYSAITGGTYYAQVSSFGDNSTYDLSAAVTCRECPTGDRNEPNDAIDTATSLSDGGDPVLGSICMSDVDYFEFEASAACFLQADLRFTHSDGDLNLTVVDAEGRTVASSMSTDDNEEIDATITEMEGTYYLQVSGGPNRVYDLRARCGCPDDDYEPNDEFAAAQTITTGMSVSGSVCEGSEDNYRFDLHMGCTATVTLTFTGDGSGDDAMNPDIDINLYNAAEEEVEDSATYMQPEMFTYTVEADGTYVLEVKDYTEGAHDYMLSVAEACP